MNLTLVASIAGRLLLGGMFLWAGLGKFGDLAGTAGAIASKGLPMPQVAAAAVAAFETLAGAALIAGWRARLSALALAAFTVVATLLFHAWWTMPAEQQFIQSLMFNKNAAIVGGLLLIAALGAGPGSLDARRDGPSAALA